MVLNKLFQKVDMYGQPIQFTYKHKNQFSTICGGVVSIIIIAFLLTYFIMLLTDIIFKKYPVILFTKTSWSSAPLVNIDMDKLLQFNEKPPFVLDNPLNPVNSSGQLSIGLYDNIKDEYMTVDPSYFYLNLEQISYNNNQLNSTQLYFQKCSRFYASKTKTDEFFKNTYCIYDYLKLKGDVLDKEYQFVKITINKCVNNTIRQSTIPRNILFSPNYSPSLYQDVFFYYPLNIINVKKDLASFNASNKGVPYPYVTKVGMGEYDKTLNIVCKPDNDINSLLSHLVIELYFTQNWFNLTEVDLPFTTNLVSRQYYFVPNLLNNVNLYYGRSMINVFGGILPSFLSNTSNTTYALTLDNEVNYFEDLDPENSVLATITIKSSPSTNNSSVTYSNILDVFGLVGGISKILLIVGGFFVIYIADIQFKESLINEFYSVIDPRNEPLINRSFKDFLECKYDKMDIEISKNNLSQYENDDENNALNTYFNKDVIFKIYQYQKKYKDDDFSFLNEENEENNTSTKKNKQDESITYIDFVKYAMVYEVFKNETYNGMNFNILEIIAVNCFFCCVPKKLRKKHNIFMKANQRLAQDTDFLSIVKAVQEFDNFKNIFFDADQLNLFNSMVNHPLTIKEINDIELKKFELKRKINEKKKEHRDFSDHEKFKKTKIEIQELIIEKEKLDNLYGGDDEEKNILPKIKRLYQSLTVLANNDDRNEYETDKKLLKNLKIKNRNEGSEEKTCLDNFLFELEKSQKRARGIRKEEKNQADSENKSEKTGEKNNVREINSEFFWEKWGNYKKK